MRSVQTLDTTYRVATGPPPVGLSTTHATLTAGGASPVHLHALLLHFGARRPVPDPVRQVRFPRSSVLLFWLLRIGGVCAGRTDGGGPSTPQITPAPRATVLRRRLRGHGPGDLAGGRPPAPPQGPLLPLRTLGHAAQAPQDPATRPEAHPRHAGPARGCPPRAWCRSGWATRTCRSPSTPTPTSTSRCRQMLLLECRLWSLVSTRDGKFCDQFRDQMAISGPKRRPRKSLTCGDAFSLGGGGGI